MLHDLRRREKSTGRCKCTGPSFAVGSRYGRDAGVGRGRGVGVHLPVHAVGVGVAVGVPVGVGVAVGVDDAVGVGVGVGPPCAQYLPPVLK